MILVLVGGFLPAVETTVKSTLFIRLDFPDKTGAPIGRSDAQRLIDEDIDAFYRANSGNRIGFSATVTDVLRMPNNSSTYSGGLGMMGLWWDANTVLSAHGIDSSGYDIVIYGFPKLAAYSWAGVSVSNGVLMNGYYGLGEVGHEIGHTFGLGHANTWKVVDGVANSEGTPESMSNEYGNTYDVMGNAPHPENHFNTMFKHLAGWIPDADAPLITTSGTYRIRAHDHQDATGPRALRLSHGEPTAQEDHEYIYWIEFRNAIAKQELRNGAVVSWQRRALSGGVPLLGGPANHLLDMHPSTGTYKDHPLSVGETFRDDRAGFTISVLGRIETPIPQLEIRVVFDGDGRRMISIGATDAAGNDLLPDPPIITPAGEDPYAENGHWHFGGLAPTEDHLLVLMSSGNG
ncbi:MAG: hypothetical protein ACOCYP_07880 [Planctomycetota bacterium]